MASCSICNNQEKKDDDDVRLAFDFTPGELIRSIHKAGCSACAIILAGLRGYESRSWAFEQDVRRVYAQCRSMRNGKSDTLCLELYFKNDRPKVELEFFSIDANGESVFPNCWISL